MVSAVYADEDRWRRTGAWGRRDGDAGCDVGEDVAYVGSVGNVFEECRVGVAGGGGAEVRDNGLEGVGECFEEGGNVVVVEFAVLGVVGAYLDGG